MRVYIYCYILICMLIFFILSGRKFLLMKNLKSVLYLEMEVVISMGSYVSTHILICASIFFLIISTMIYISNHIIICVSIFFIIFTRVNISTYIIMRVSTFFYNLYTNLYFFFEIWKRLIKKDREKYQEGVIFGDRGNNFYENLYLYSYGVLINKSVYFQ
jgi:hypothetical protein